ncbi:MAG: hypothetical protein ACREOD_06380 [Candidatus Dormibacteria bacterium]
MRHLLRHPLMFLLGGLVVLFVVFFLILPALSVLFHLVILAAILWVVLSLWRVHRHHLGRS